ncbi:DNA-binding protein [Streptomyces naphthomycinicus]|uniref:nSTAND1 domain-containing NTPase n=1 Tax=Streptomyces naphthomycinicus TaxID=2872625 RepID=UPI001CECE24C|nr:DNA-binding protein [Streptomyces sp. TML10]
MAGRRENPVDPTAGPVARFAGELRKLRSEAGSPTYRVLAQRTGQGASTLSQAAAGDRLPTLPVVLAYVRACGGDPEQWETRWRETVAEAAAEPRADEDAEAPYRGLARFEPGDADLFFGRDQLTDRLLDLAASHRFTAVFGPSGSGKSSLLRAGLIPRLRTPGPDRASPAALRVLTPGEHPLRTHGQRLTPKDGDGDTWLIVDQFEELYTLCRDPVERDRFVGRLLAAADPASRLRVVIAVRADFLGRCAEHAELTAMLQDGSVLVGPMSRDELREAVIRPAQAGGLIVERSLTDRILDEVEGEPGALPLMSHALLETWRRRKGRALTEAAYEAAGGLRGAIARTAEGVYVGMSPDRAELTRAVLLRLVTPGDGTPDTRRPVRREELDFASPAEIAAVLDRLTRARLLTLDDDTVDLAHEALITAWPRLHAWIDSERSRLRLHRRLTEDAQAWNDLGRDPGALYRGTRLAAAEEAFAEPGGRADFTALERSFLAAGLDAREREQRATLRSARRLRWLLASVSVLAVLAVLAGLLGWQQSRAADAERVRTEARRLAAVADTLRLSDPATAMKLSVAAWKIADLPETRSALLAVAAQLPRDAFRVPDSASALVDLSQDGRTLVTLRDGRAERWDVRTHHRLSRFTVHTQDNPAFALSPDGKRLAVSTTSGIQLYSTATGLPDSPVLRTPGPPQEVAFGASGRTLLATARSVCKETGAHAFDHTPLHPAQLWDLHRRTVLFDTCPGAAWTDDSGLGEVFQGTGDAHTFVKANSSGIVAISPDDRLVAVCRPDGGVQVWQVAGRRRRLPGRWERTSSDHGCPTAAFAPGGHALLLTTDDGLVMWNMSSGRATGTYTHEGVREIGFSADGRLFATTDDRDVLLWRVDHPTAPVLGSTLPHQSSPGTVRFDRADGVIRYTSGSSDSTVWSVSLGHADDGGWHADSTTAAAFSPDGTRLATARQAGGTHRLTLLDVPTGHGTAVPLPTAPCPPDPDFAQVDDSGTSCGDILAFGPDNRTFAYSGGGGDEEAATKLAVLDSRDMARHRVLRLPGSGEDADTVDGLAITPDGNTVLASLSYERTELWDLRRAARIARLPDVAGSLSLSPDGRLLATSEGDVVRLPSRRRTSHTLTSDRTTVVAQDPAGGHLAAGDEAGGVTLWDATAAHRLGDLTAAPDPTEPADANGNGSTAGVSALVFSHDGTVLAVGAEDGTVRLWDVTSRKPIGGPLHMNAGTIKALAFSADGRTLRAAGGHVPLVAYELTPRRSVARLCGQVGAGLTRSEWSTYVNGVAYRHSC